MHPALAARVRDEERPIPVEAEPLQVPQDAVDRAGTAPVIDPGERVLLPSGPAAALDLHGVDHAGGVGVALGRSDVRLERERGAGDGRRQHCWPRDEHRATVEPTMAAGGSAGWDGRGGGTMEMV